MNLDLQDLFDAEGTDAPPPTLDRDVVMTRGRALRRRRHAVAGGVAVVAVVFVTAGSFVIPGPRSHSRAPIGPQPTASPLSSQELAASCTAFAASDRSSVPPLTFDTAKTLTGSAVPLCVVPKPGLDGLVRLEGSTAQMTTSPEWAEAISFDRPLPSGVAVSLSYDMYAFVNGEWLLARLTGRGTSAR